MRCSSEFLLALGERGVLANALLALGFSGGALLLNREDAALQIGMETIDALECGLRPAAALFKAGELGGELGCFLLKVFAFPAHFNQRRLLRLKGRLCLVVLGLHVLGFGALLLDQAALGFAGVLVARGLKRPLLQAAIDALDLSVHLAERRALVGQLLLCLAALFAACFQLAIQFFNGMRQRGGGHLRFSERALPR